MSNAHNFYVTLDRIEAEADAAADLAAETDMSAVCAIRIMSIAIDECWDQDDWNGAGMTAEDYKIGMWADLVYAPVSDGTNAPVAVSGVIG